MFVVIFNVCDDDQSLLVMGVCVSLTLEQQELCRVRLKLLQFIDRLLTYQVCYTFFCFIYRHQLSFRILDGASQLSLPSLARSSS